MYGYRDRVVFITGGASGIGKAIAESFAQAGAQLAIADLDRAKAQEFAAELEAKGTRALGFGCDVSDEAQLQAAIEGTVEAFGRLDVLINNAGLQFVSPIEDFPTAKFEQMVKVLLVAPFTAIKHAFPVMKRQGYGRVLNVASINGLVGFAGKAAYNSAKHGVIGLTKVAALEGAAHGITVNALCPGYVDTPLVRNQLESLSQTRNVPLSKVLEEVIYPLVPQQRLLDVQEIADYALFLASTKAGGVTGQAVVVDGGYTAQ
jgi:3-hydroxybutyrate dehydrogenase